MLTINQFKNVKNSFIDKNITIDEILSTIKDGDSNRETILAIRKLGKSSTVYQKTKTHYIPTFRFNFKFEGKASNETIIEPTGLIYIDVDDSTCIDLTNPYIYASWKSLSETGLGILVKVDGLSLSNFKDTYREIGVMLGVMMDIGAGKATQQNVLSYDPDIYVNKSSFTFQAINKKVSSSVIQEGEKRERLITVNDTFLNSEKIRFNNIGDYFKDTDGDYIVFNEKKNLCIPFIPKRIHVGNRNTIMFGVLSQYALLNPTMENGFLIKCANVINNCFIQKYEEEKIKSIVAGVIKKRSEGTLEPYLNKERKIIFNPNKKISPKEKQKTTAILMGKIKTDKTQKNINNTIDDWNFQIDGKITQEKIAEKLNKSLATIKRNWSPFKEFVCKQNITFKESIITSSNYLAKIKAHPLEVIKIEPEAMTKNELKLKTESTPNQIEVLQENSITLERFISNCKYKFGSYIEDYRFDRLKKDIEYIWELKLMKDVTDEIKNYINSQIDYQNKDGYYVKLCLFK